MLTLTECKKILNRSGLIYTEEEIELLRNFLYLIAEIEIERIIKN
jgi:hypothetical protein